MKITIPYKPHPAQQAFHNSNARFRVLACGRRFGKTMAAANEAIRLATLKSKCVGWIVAPVFGQTMIFWRMIRKFLPKQLISRVSKSERYIQLINGSEIWFKSADNPDLLRGEGLDWVIMDECAMIKREAWEEALRPALWDKSGRGVFISTPKGYNWFYEAWKRGQDKEDKDFESWQFSSQLNPYLSEEDFKEMKASLPDRVFRQEVLAEFIEDAGSVFRNIRECVCPGILRKEPESGHRYVLGVDLARYEDFTALVVCDIDDRKIVYVDKFNIIDWTLQKARIVTVAKKFHNALIIIDSTGLGDPIYDDLRDGELLVRGFRFTNKSKKDLINNLSILIEQEKIKLPKHEDLLGELFSFTYTHSQFGNIKFSAPSGYHDDLVIALALSCWGLKVGGGSISWNVAGFNLR